MAVNGKEGFWERTWEFFTQKPEDYAYENMGGDADMPVERRTADPLADANTWAREQGKDLPYPNHPSAKEGFVNEAPLLSGEHPRKAREARGDVL